MFIFLLVISLLGVGVLFFNSSCIRESIVKSILFFSLLVLGITELLSFFSALNYLNLLICWSLVSIGLILFILNKKKHLTLNSVRNKFKERLRKLSKWEKFFIVFSAFICLGIFIQGIVYPTNNWDSMAYHMARIIHWIQNETLSHYRTTVHPQLISPPFAEVLILNINLLVGNDYFSNSVQLFYLIMLGIVTTLTAKKLGLNRFGQILVFFILVCLPELILLGSSTHNEIVVSFFIVSSIYFLILINEERVFKNFFLLGCSLGLAVVTKNTAYIYLTPFVIFSGLYQAYLVVFKRLKVKWGYYFLTISVFLLINIGHYTRNYQLTSNILGTNEAIHNYYVNEKHSFLGFISNVTRNLSNQFGVPKVAPIAYGLTEQMHKMIGVDLNDPTITSHSYSIDPLATHENNGANFYHTILMLLSIIWILVNIKNLNKLLLIYWGTIILSFFLFCFYLKWQPWAKLHIPFFIFYSIVLAYFLIYIYRAKLLFFVIIVGFVVFSTLTLTFNWSRPFITYPPFTSEIKLTDTRYKKYFSRFLRYHADYACVKDKIDELNLKNIGLITGRYDMEYQLFLNSYRSKLKPIHINSCELSSEISVVDKVDCIVSTLYKDSIVYRNKQYNNVMKDNDGYLYLFLEQK